MNEFEGKQQIPVFGVRRPGQGEFYGAWAIYRFTYQPPLDVRSRVLLSLQIMMQFSRLYETSQKGFLFNVAGGFSVEDLPSNYLGSLVALNELMPGSTGLDRKQIEKLCHVLNTEDSLSMLKFGTGKSENDSHIPALWSWRGIAFQSSYGYGATVAGGMQAVKNNCDPCAKADKKVPTFFNDFPTDQGGNFFKVANSKVW